MVLHEMTKINLESLQLGPGLEEVKGEHKPQSRSLVLPCPCSINFLYSTLNLLTFTTFECQIKFTGKKNQNDKRASVHLEFYLLIISLPLPFKMNYQFFKESPHCSPQWLYQFAFPPTVQEGSLFSTPSPAFIACRFLDHSHSDWCEVVPHCGFDLYFSNNE